MDRKIQYLWYCITSENSGRCSRLLLLLLGLTPSCQSSVNALHRCGSLCFHSLAIRADDTNPLKKRPTFGISSERSAFVLTDPRRINQARTMRVLLRHCPLQALRLLPNNDSGGFLFSQLFLTGSSAAFESLQTVIAAAAAAAAAVAVRPVTSGACTILHPIRPAMAPREPTMPFLCFRTRKSGSASASRQLTVVVLSQSTILMRAKKSSYVCKPGLW